MNETTETTDLLIPISYTHEQAVALFTNDDEFASLYDKIEQVAREHKADVSTNKGRDELRSLAHKITRTKTTLDKLGAGLTEEWRNKVTMVDKHRKGIRDKLDALRDEVRKPLTEYEEAEKARQEAVGAKMDRLADIKRVPFDASAKAISALLNEVDEIATFDGWGEDNERAQEVIEDTMRILRTAKNAAVERERIAAEHAAMEAERQERDRLERERAELAQREQEAREKAEAAQRAEMERLQREKAEAEERAVAAEKAAAEAAQRAKLEAEEMRKREEQRVAKEEAERAEREAKAEADRKEQERQEREREAKAAERRKESLDDLERYFPEHYTGIYDAIASGKIRHIVVEK